MNDYLLEFRDVSFTYDEDEKEKKFGSKNYFSHMNYFYKKNIHIPNMLKIKYHAVSLLLSSDVTVPVNQHLQNLQTLYFCQLKAACLLTEPIQKTLIMNLK